MDKQIVRRTDKMTAWSGSGW